MHEKIIITVIMRFSLLEKLFFNVKKLVNSPLQAAGMSADNVRGRE